MVCLMTGKDSFIIIPFWEKVCSIRKPNIYKTVHVYSIDFSRNIAYALNCGAISDSGTELLVHP